MKFKVTLQSAEIASVGEFKITLLIIPQALEGHALELLDSYSEPE